MFGKYLARDILIKLLMIIVYGGAGFVGILLLPKYLLISVAILLIILLSPSISTIVQKIWVLPEPDVTTRVKIAMFDIGFISLCFLVAMLIVTGWQYKVALLILMVLVAYTIYKRAAGVANGG